MPFVQYNWWKTKCSFGLCLKLIPWLLCTFSLLEFAWSPDSGHFLLNISRTAHRAALRTGGKFKSLAGGRSSSGGHPKFLSPGDLPNFCSMHCKMRRREETLKRQTDVFHLVWFLKGPSELTTIRPAKRLHYVPKRNSAYRLPFRRNSLIVFAVSLF